MSASEQPKAAIRLLILSDLHLEFATFQPPDPTSFDIAVLAGDIGRQLLDHYLETMRITHNWSSWPEAKRARASLGMHGLGLTHAFGHSVPKASLPLLWAGGDVTLNGRRVKWNPLFENA